MRGASPRRLVIVPLAFLLTVPALAVGATSGPGTVPSNDEHWAARMRAYLANEYLRADAVEPAAVVITAQADRMVGDVPLRRVEATINAEGKQTAAFFDARTGRFVSSYAPDYYEASGGRIGWRATQWLRGAPTAAVGFTVDFAPPAGYVWGDQFQKAELTSPEVAALLGGEVQSLVALARERPLTEEEGTRFADEAYAAATAWNLRLLGDLLGQRAAEARGTPGVTDVRAPEAPSAARLYVHGNAAAVVALAAHPEALAVELLDTGAGGGWETDWNLAVAKDASGAKAANDRGIRGSGNKIASVDTGISSVWVNGLDCIAYAQYGVWGNSPGATDPAPGGHGTAIAWVLVGGKTYGGTVCTGEEPGIARDATLYNAKIVNTDGTHTQAAFEGAVDYSANTWQVNVGTTAAGKPESDIGNHYMSRYLDYTVYAKNRVWVNTPGNNRDLVTAPGGAYNSVVVGALDDRNTASRGDDLLYNDGASAATPQVSQLSDGRHKPDVVMPGKSVRLPKNDGTWAQATGTSFAAPFASAGMNLQSTFYTGKEKKCGLIVSTPQGSPWQTGWGRGFPHIDNAITVDGYQNYEVSNGGAWWWDNVNVPAGKTLYVALVWWREMSSPSTITRYSDLDLHVYDANRVNVLAQSAGYSDNNEKTKWTNTGGSTVAVDLRVYGWSVPGSTPQTYSMCWDIR